MVDKSKKPHKKSWFCRHKLEIAFVVVLLAAILSYFWPVIFRSCPPAGVEVLEKRTPTSKTISLGECQFRLQAVADPAKLHFWDGSQYLPVEGEGIDPYTSKLEETVKNPLASEDGENVFVDLGSYTLHSALHSEPGKEGEISIFDLEGSEVLKFFPIKATDAKQKDIPITYNRKETRSGDHLTLSIRGRFLADDLIGVSYPIIISNKVNSSEDES